MREAKFRQAALAYRIYGVIYLVGAVYLVLVGVGARGTTGPGPGWLLVFAFTLGLLFVVLFPWLIARGPHGWGYLWFTRLLAVFLLVRVVGVARVARAPSVPTVPLPGGGEVSMSLGATVFALIALATAVMVARAGWNLPP